MSNFDNYNDETNMKKRTETQAYKISEEIMDILHDDESGCYKPWQFADYKVKPDTLKTTYDEIVLLGKQEAMIRPGWNIGIREINVPNLFAKVNGVHEDVKVYREEVNSLVEEDNTLFFKKFPLYKKKYKKNVSKAFFQMSDLNGVVDKERLLTSEYWKYKRLNPVMQEIMADKIVELCRIPSLWKYDNFKVKVNLSIIDKIKAFILSLADKEEKEKRDMKLSTFAVLTNLDEELVDLLKGFDYPLKVPKIIVYNNNKGRGMTFGDALTLMFMNALGVDIIIYNPAGASDIENYIKEGYYDVHRLERTRENLPYKKNSLLYRITK
jgi:hypothetical protein